MVHAERLETDLDHPSVDTTLGELPDELTAPMSSTESASLEVAVIGGGAIGATAAYDLANRGVDVTLFEAAEVASGATQRAAGICYDAFTEPTDAQIAGEAIDRLRRLSGDDTFPFVECPYVWLAREGDGEQAESLEAGIRTMQDNGVIALEVDGGGLGDRFPALVTEDVAVAGIAGAAGYVDPVAYTACLAAAATGVGATIETETPVTVTDGPTIAVDGVERPVDAVVVAAGAGTPQVLIEHELPLTRYESSVVVAETDPIDEPMGYDTSTGVYFRPHETGLLVGSDEAVSAEALCSRAAERLAGSLEVARSWTGECTTTPDWAPLVGSVSPDVFVATGFDGEGFMRAPAIGEHLASMVLDGETIDAYDPQRFEDA